jgi:hypothetical protein
VYAPHHFGGIGLQDMDTEQGIAHTAFILGHLRVDTDIAFSKYNFLKSFITIAGTATSPLQDLTQYKYAIARWLEISRRFLTASTQ